MFLSQCVVSDEHSIVCPRISNTLWVGVWTPKHLLRRLLGVPSIYSPGIWRILDTVEYSSLKNHIAMTSARRRNLAEPVGPLPWWNSTEGKSKRLLLLLVYIIWEPTFPSILGVNQPTYWWVYNLHSWYPSFCCTCRPCIFQKKQNSLEFLAIKQKQHKEFGVLPGHGYL